MTGLDYSLGAAFAASLVWLKTGRSPIAWMIRGLLHVQAAWLCVCQVIPLAWSIARDRYQGWYEQAQRDAGR